MCSSYVPHRGQPRDGRGGEDDDVPEADQREWGDPVDVGRIMEDVPEKEGERGKGESAKEEDGPDQDGRPWP